MQPTNPPERTCNDAVHLQVERRTAAAATAASGTIPVNNSCLILRSHPLLRKHVQLAGQLEGQRAAAGGALEVDWLASEAVIN